jgi:hypothetical protein
MRAFHVDQAQLVQHLVASESAVGADLIPLDGHPDVVQQGRRSSPMCLGAPLAPDVVAEVFHDGPPLSVMAVMEPR